MSIDFSKIPTPCFVLEEKLLRRNLSILKKVQEEAGVSILCALKGFAFWSAFPLVRQYLSGATASSLHEAMLCYEEMKSPAHLCCPVYTEIELEQMIPISSHITFNSLAQFEKSKKKILIEKPEMKMALRINPEYSETTTDLYNPCVPGSRLGIFADQLPERLPKEITGLHFHSLFAADSYTLERTLQEIEKRFELWLQQIQWFNMGGGHHITRKDYDTQHLVTVLKAFKQKYAIDIFMEPGEAVGWQTGFLITTVQDIIDSKGIRVAMLDTSISAHMPDCIEMPYKPKVRFATDAVDRKTPWRLGGMTCLAGDFVGEYHFEHDLQIGDKIIFEDMIHYTMVKTTTFNGINLPNIAIAHENGNLEVVKTFGYQDYKSRLS